MCSCTTWLNWCEQIQVNIIWFGPFVCVLLVLNNNDYIFCKVFVSFPQDLLQEQTEAAAAQQNIETLQICTLISDCVTAAYLVSQASCSRQSGTAAPHELCDSPLFATPTWEGAFEYWNFFLVLDLCVGAGRRALRVHVGRLHVFEGELTLL